MIVDVISTTTKAWIGNGAVVNSTVGSDTQDISVTATDNTAAVSPTTCVLPPARSEAAVLERLPATPRPPTRPDAMLAAPAASSSWSASTR